MRKLARILGSLLIVAGVLTLAWVVLVWRWQDPFTAFYTHLQQTRLSHTYERRALQVEGAFDRAIAAGSGGRQWANAS